MSQPVEFEGALPMRGMSYRTRSLVALLALAGAVASARSGGAAVAEITQSFQLQPGWNSVFLEVRPEDNSAEAVFGGLPLASAWTWNPSEPKFEFVDNPDELVAPNAQWLGYFPFPRPESILTNLFAVQANRASDLLAAMRLADEFKLKLVLVGAAEGDDRAACGLRLFGADRGSRLSHAPAAARPDPPRHPARPAASHAGRGRGTASL